jgi:hypothetical protein
VPLPSSRRTATSATDTQSIRVVGGWATVAVRWSCSVRAQGSSSFELLITYARRDGYADLVKSFEDPREVVDIIGRAPPNHSAVARADETRCWSAAHALSATRLIAGWIKLKRRLPATKVEKTKTLGWSDFHKVRQGIEFRLTRTFH